MDDRTNRVADWIITGGFFCSGFVGFLVFQTARTQLWHLRGLTPDVARNIGIGLGVATFLGLLLIVSIVGVVVKVLPRAQQPQEATRAQA